MNPLIVEILQLCMLLETKGRIVKFSWHSPADGVRGRVYIEIWNTVQDYREWLEADDYPQQTICTPYCDQSQNNLHGVIAKLKEAMQ